MGERIPWPGMDRYLINNNHVYCSYTAIYDTSNVLVHLSKLISLEKKVYAYDCMHLYIGSIYRNKLHDFPLSASKPSHYKYINKTIEILFECIHYISAENIYFLFLNFYFLANA